MAFLGFYSKVANLKLCLSYSNVFFKICVSFSPVVFLTKLYRILHLVWTVKGLFKNLKGCLHRFGGFPFFFFMCVAFSSPGFLPQFLAASVAPNTFISIWQDYIFDLRSFCCTSAVLTVVPHGESCVNVDLISFFVFFFFQWLNPLLFLPAFGH